MKKEVIVSAHSMDTSFFALTSEGDLICFSTGEEGIIPIGYPDYEYLVDDFIEIASELSGLPEVRNRIEENRKYYDDENKIIKSENIYLLKDFMYHYCPQKSKKFVLDILEYNLDFGLNAYTYTLQSRPKSVNDEVRNVITDILDLPVIQPESTIRFYEGRRWSDPQYTVIEEVIYFLVRKDKGFWRQLKDMFSDDRGGCIIFYPRLVSKEKKSSLFIMYPNLVDILKRKVFCGDFSEYEMLLKEVPNAVVCIKDDEELLDFVRDYYWENIKPKLKEGK